MALTDTFVRQVKHTGKPAGDAYADGGGMYLLVKAAGKYWRMDWGTVADCLQLVGGSDKFKSANGSQRRHAMDCHGVSSTPQSETLFKMTVLLTVLFNLPNP